MVQFGWNIVLLKCMRSQLFMLVIIEICGASDSATQKKPARLHSTSRCGTYAISPCPHVDLEIHRIQDLHQLQSRHKVKKWWLSLRIHVFFSTSYLATNDQTKLWVFNFQGYSILKTNDICPYFWKLSKDPSELELISRPTGVGWKLEHVVSVLNSTCWKAYCYHL